MCGVIYAKTKEEDKRRNAQNNNSSKNNKQKKQQQKNNANSTMKHVSSGDDNDVFVVRGPCVGDIYSSNRYMLVSC